MARKKVITVGEKKQPERKFLETGLSALEKATRPPASTPGKLKESGIERNQLRI